jgi:hypothetical protein
LDLEAGILNECPSHGICLTATNFNQCRIIDEDGAQLLVAKVVITIENDLKKEVTGWHGEADRVYGVASRRSCSGVYLDKFVCNDIIVSESDIALPIIRQSFGLPKEMEIVGLAGFEISCIDALLEEDGIVNSSAGENTCNC